MQGGRNRPLRASSEIVDDSSESEHSDRIGPDEKKLAPASSCVSKATSGDRNNGHHGTKRARLATDGQNPSTTTRRRTSPPRRKIDPKIIDDSSDDESSDDESDEEQLGPVAAPDDDADELPVTHEAVFGSTHRGYVSGLALDGAGARLHTGAQDGTVKLWDFNTMDWTLHSFREESPLEGAAVHGLSSAHTGGHVLCWGALPKVRILDREGRPLAQTPAGDMYLVDAARSKGHAGPVRAARWLRAGGIVSVATEGAVRVWDVEDARRTPMEAVPVMRQVTITKLRNARGSRAIAQALAALDGSLVAVACDDRSVKVLDARSRSGRPAQLAANVTAPGGEFTALEAAPDAAGAPLLLARSTDDSLRVLDRRRLDEPLATFGELPNSISETAAVFVGASGMHFATGTSASRRGGTAAGRVVLFSRSTMRQVAAKPVPQDAGSVVGMRWHERLNQIVYGCGDGSVRAMYDPQLSSGGVLKCVVRERRRKVQGLVSVGVGPVLTPGEASRHGDGESKRARMEISKARQPKSYSGPETSKIGNTRSLAKFVREAGIEQKWDEDPRQALLKFDEVTKRNPVFTKAYRKTQPEVLLSEKTAEQEQEDTLREATKLRRAKKDDE